MSARWVLNRLFQARPLDLASRRWILESADDATRSSHVQIVFQGPDSAVVEGAVDIREIRSQAEGSETRFLIDGPREALTVKARAMQVHETPGPQYAAALPPTRVPAIQRWSWRLLLAALRIPGVFALVARLRGRR